MDVKVRIERDRGLRIHTVTGAVTFDELQSALAATYQGDPEVRDMDSLWDLSEAQMAISSEEIQRISAFVSSQWGEGGAAKSALVVSEDLAFGLARMYEAQVTQEVKNQVGVFREIGEARLWLDEGLTAGGGRDGK